MLFHDDSLQRTRKAALRGAFPFFVTLQRTLLRALRLSAPNIRAQPRILTMPRHSARQNPLHV